MKIPIIIGAIIVASAFSISFNGGEKHLDDGEWNRTYEWKEEGAVMDIVIDGNGYLVVGYELHYYDNGRDDGDAHIMKIDKEGNVVWDKKWMGKKYTVLNSIIRTKDGFLASGYKGINQMDFWVVKIDDNGNEIWNKTYGYNNRDDFCAKIIKANDKGYLLVGTSASSFDWGKNKILLIKIDENGNEIWNRTYGKESERGYDVISTKNGYMIAGLTGTYSKYGDWDVWIVKIDDNGNEIWNKTYGGALEAINDVKKISDGYILAGGTETYGVGGVDAWLLKVDKNGNEIWNKSFGNRGDDYAESVIYDNGYYVIVGNKGETKTNGTDAWIIKCADYPPPRIKIVRPKKNYLYIFDREIMPFHKTMIIGKVTIVANVTSAYEDIKRVEFYLTWLGRKYEYEPRAILYSPPYEWKFDVPAVSLNNPVEITVAAYYGNAGAVAVDKIELYIINPFPAPASLHKSKAINWSIAK